MTGAEQLPHLVPYKPWRKPFGPCLQETVQQQHQQRQQGVQRQSSFQRQCQVCSSGQCLSARMQTATRGSSWCQTTGALRLPPLLLLQAMQQQVLRQQQQPAKPGHPCTPLHLRKDRGVQ